MITPAFLHALGASAPDTWAPLLSAAIEQNEIRNVPDFLANVMFETTMLRNLRESLNYTVAGLREVWPGRFSPALAAQLGRIDGAHRRAADQWWIAEHAYGGRMGNRAPGHGDGWDFRGAGALQTTGRDNTEAFGRAIEWTGTLVALAAHLATPEGAAESAGSFWRTSQCDNLADSIAIRRRINGTDDGIGPVLELRQRIVDLGST